MEKDTTLPLSSPALLAICPICFSVRLRGCGTCCPGCVAATSLLCLTMRCLSEACARSAAWHPLVLCDQIYTSGVKCTLKNLHFRLTASPVLFPEYPGGQWHTSWWCVAVITQRVGTDVYGGGQHSAPPSGGEVKCSSSHGIITTYCNQEFRKLNLYEI